MAEISVDKVIAIVRASTRSGRVAAAYRRLAAWPLAFLVAWFSTLIVVAIIEAIVSAISDHKVVWDEASGVPTGRLALPVAIAAVVLGRRRIRAAADALAEPIFPRPARSEWPSYARASGVVHAIIGLLAFPITWTAVSLVVYNTVRLWSDGPPLSDLVLTAPLVVLGLPLLIWAYFLGRSDRLSQLQSATPPALRRAHRLRDHAQALEDAMQEATLMADELQETIDAEKRLIADLLSESTEARRIVEIESGQLNALLAHQERQQRHSTRRERWINIAVAAVSLFIGYLLNLASPAFFTGLFRH
ncbi:hypothetical protein [Kribbella albertanoniae]|uniref:Transmembrane protein n=1 Tax=Kribbella albertanoniae TaxID=1266829 RepID=A0A4R4QJQ0_9ACTN|nr:hypothetical protein [Kribbella albertanoniae]TDC35543.1 hypothetical protein E1261_01385 [Kribbella albertanoniae]